MDEVRQIVGSLIFAAAIIGGLVAFGYITWQIWKPERFRKD